MGRGKDKTINRRDIQNMSPGEFQGLSNMARMGRVKIKGAAVVRSHVDGNAKYDDPKRKGQYHEDKI